MQHTAAPATKEVDPPKIQSVTIPCFCRETETQVRHKAALEGEEEELGRIRNELEITLQKYKEAQQALLEIPTLRARVETLQSQVDAERKVCSYRLLLISLPLY